jgi:hypothetical protein
MRPRDVLAKNLIALMEANPSLRSVELLVEAGAGTTGTLDRIKRREASTGVDNLDPIAKAFGLSSPWQLLVPTMKVLTEPDGKVQVVGLPDWPFDRIDSRRYTSLDVEDKAYVQGQLEQAIKACEERQRVTGKSVADSMKPYGVGEPAKASTSRKKRSA